MARAYKVLVAAPYGRDNAITAVRGQLFKKQCASDKSANEKFQPQDSKAGRFLHKAVS